MEKKMKYLVYSVVMATVVVFLALALFSFKSGIVQVRTIENLTIDKNYFDGPYILYHGEEALIYRVNKGLDGSVITRESVSVAELRQMKVEVFPDGKDADLNQLKPFQVSLFDFQMENQWDFEQPEKVFAIADIESNFSNTEAILRAGGVIDNDFNWIYGSNHLVVNGDLFSRGLDMMALLWLVYKLDYEALLAGGKVHVMIGNHEAMNLKGDVRYVEKRYLEFCEKISEEYKSLFDENTELGRWLRTKNTISRIGRNLIVHGGISKEYLTWGLSISEVNEIVRQNLGKQTSELDEQARLVFGSMGPHWYRGMVFTGENRNPVFAEDMPPLLEFFDVDRFIVGHCKGEDIFKLRDRKVVVIDVNHSKNRQQERARALQIEIQNGIEKLSKINDLGEFEPIAEKQP
jgi:hypothetical protein